MSDLFQVYLDFSARSGRVMAHLLEPPGLGIRVESREAFEAGLSTAITDHLNWLAHHGHWPGSAPSPDAIRWHVAGAELWYITRVIDDPDQAGMPPDVEELDRRMDATDDPVERLVLVREGFERFFRSLAAEWYHRVVTPTWYCDITTERWTARKALRRAIEHEREHTRNIRRILDTRG